LGDAVFSWIGTGNKLAISAQQNQQALGGGKIPPLAQNHVVLSKENHAKGFRILTVLPTKPDSQDFPLGFGFRQHDPHYFGYSIA
jgi:hypothetical protein